MYLKYRFYRHLKKKIGPVAFALSLGPQHENNDSIHAETFCLNHFWAVGISKRIFPLKIQRKYFYDHNYFSIL